MHLHIKKTSKSIFCVPNATQVGLWVLLVIIAATSYWMKRHISHVFLNQKAGRLHFFEVLGKESRNGKSNQAITKTYRQNQEGSWATAAEYYQQFSHLGFLNDT